MKKHFILILVLSFALPAHSLIAYKASYDLYGQTDLANIKFGSAEYELIVSNNLYFFRNNAKTDKIWKAIYDFSIIETSIGLIEGNKLISDYYKIIEQEGDTVSENFEINIYPNERYTTVKNVSIDDTTILNNLNKLSDKDLILKAVASGNYTKIRFSGSNANDPNTPSFKKKLGNRKQLIEALLDATWEVNSTDSDLVDRLSIYLHISQDIQKDPNKKSFFYQIVDKKGINQREFTIDGIETIEIGKNAIETIRIVCPELKLVFNVSEDYNFMPVYISKTNGKTNFQLTLTDYNQ